MRIKIPYGYSFIFNTPVMKMRVSASKWGKKELSDLFPECDIKSTKSITKHRVVKEYFVIQGMGKNLHSRWEKASAIKQLQQAQLRLEEITQMSRFYFD